MKNYVLFSMLIGGVVILFALVGCFGDKDPVLTGERLVFGPLSYTVGGYGVTACLDTPTSPGVVVIPESHDGRTVEGIGNFAFARCGNISSLTIPASVVNIGSNAFQGCARLAEIVIHAEMPPVMGSNPFILCPALATIRVPAASLEAYKVAPGWMEWSSIIVADTAASSSSSSSGSALYDPDPTSRLIINNTGSSDIVLFNDAAIPANLLGGVKAFATRHGVPKMPSGVHVVKVVTAADYAANPASPKVCYSFLVNTDYEPDAFDINVTSGDCALQINNQTDAYLEVRSTAFAGPRVAVLRPYEIEHIYRQAGEETFFAFVERPKTTSPAGLRIVNAGVYSVSLQPETTGSLTVSPTSFIATNHAAAYIKVVNNRSSAVQMYRSSVLLHDAWNRTIIPSGMSSGLYNLEMSASPLEGQSYTFLSSLAVEVATSTVFTYNSGYVYTISLGPGSQTATVANNGTYENFFP